MAAGVAFDMLMKRETILGVLRRYHAPGNTFSQYYRMGVQSEPVATIYGNKGQYDIFDGTRTLGAFSAFGAPPTRINRKPIGSVPIVVPRQYMAIDVNLAELYGSRDLGQNFMPPVRGRGLAYYQAQLLYMKTRMNTTTEWMASQMMQNNGFGVKNFGGGATPILVPCLATDPQRMITNEGRVPSDHFVDCNGIFTDSWEDPTTDIPGQLMELQFTAARENGRNLTEVWVNGTVGRYLFNNDKLSKQVGLSNRIFDTLNPSKTYTDEQEFPDTGYTVVFGALPTWKFHIYNQGYVDYGTAETMAAQTSEANWKPFIEANRAVITPPPPTAGEPWCGMCAGSELAQWSELSPPEEVVGFGMGANRAIEPPRIEGKALYNGAPVLLEPKAIYAPTVTGASFSS